MIESFWSRMQVELLDRQRWRTRIELANAIFDYLEIWHNRQRRHSALGMLSPIVLRRRHLQPWRENPASSLRDSRGTPEPPRIRGDSRATLTQVDTRNKP
jgi:putative transposase